MGSVRWVASVAAVLAAGCAMAVAVTPFAVDSGSAGGDGGSGGDEVGSSSSVLSSSSTAAGVVEAAPAAGAAAAAVVGRPVVVAGLDPTEAPMMVVAAVQAACARSPAMSLRIVRRPAPLRRWRATSGVARAPPATGGVLRVRRREAAGPAAAGPRGAGPAAGPRGERPHALPRAELRRCVAPRARARMPRRLVRAPRRVLSPRLRAWVHRIAAPDKSAVAPAEPQVPLGLSALVARRAGPCSAWYAAPRTTVRCRAPRARVAHRPETCT